MKESAIMQPQASETDTDQPCVVLLVDDQEMVAEGIRRMVEDEPGIELHYCQDPRNAIQMATELKVTTILQDLVMPEIDGIMLVRFYRANPVTQDIPVIVLSSKEDPTIKSDAFSCGANDYLVKLPDKIELVARVRAHSRSYLLQRERDAAYHALREIQRQLEESNTQLEESNRELQRLSSLDGLTGIANTAASFERGWTRGMAAVPAATAHGPWARADVDDIEYFKRYTRHPRPPGLGDDCLKAVARELDHVIHRPSDLMARYGGEEFGVILPDTDDEGALQVAEKRRRPSTHQSTNPSTRGLHSSRRIIPEHPAAIATATPAAATRWT
ncbi:response regulator [Thiohalobacter thiocyanaticus]|uniref:Response regulator n=1 Tax=Thiohalobacter thiocyanaticus TaxID=585455 RepID=A0A426QLT0_9GAMM|nr:response regulator [Thiohalobacter thiocyanaticus]RRQ22710.1 response regulator [Thiohalobacter thiocyanaticus]